MELQTKKRLSMVVNWDLKRTEDNQTEIGTKNNHISYFIKFSCNVQLVLCI